MSSGVVPAAPLGLMSCVRESSPQDLFDHHINTELDIERNESSKKRRFHPFRGLRKMFRRGRVRTAGSEQTVPTEGSSPGPSHENSSSAKESHRSRSTSELLTNDVPVRRKSSGGVSGGGVVGGGLYPGNGALSLSHDSVFTAEQRSIRGDSTSSDLDTAQSSSSLSIQLMQHTAVRAELIDVVRRRGQERGDTSEDEEDLGLPRSPCNSPTNTDKPMQDHQQTKSHSTCSDGSLLSMGSSEMDEESFGQHSGQSSKLSLHDRRPSHVADVELELGINTSVTAPLSHSAARHKMAVRPKRRHGAPRRRRVQQLSTSALPTTPELNEDVSTRSLTPESSTTRETIAELYSSSSTSMSKVWSAPSAVVNETQIKSASLPPGLALPAASAKLSRSRSNAGSRNARETFHEEDEPDDLPIKGDKKKEESFFGRFLSRRSAKKKKSKSEDVDVIASTICSTTSISVAEKVETEPLKAHKHSEEKRTYSVDSGISKVIRSGPASRQRVQPIDIPASPTAGFRYKRQQNIDLDLPMPPFTTSPEPSPPKKHHGYLTKPTKFVSSTSLSEKQIDPSIETFSLPSTRTIFQTSPPKPSWLENKLSLKSVCSESKSIETYSKSEECKTKVKITGLSPYQQRVITYNNDTDSSELKSIVEPCKEESVAKSFMCKSHSFRSKSVLNATHDHVSLPIHVNSSNFDNHSESETFTDSLISTSNTPNTYSSTTQSTSEHISATVEDIENHQDKQSDTEEDEIKIISTNNIEFSVNDKALKSNSCEHMCVSSRDQVNVSEKRLENKDDGITISCVNSQMQASVNTQSSNQVIVNISSTAGPVLSMNDLISTSTSLTTKTFTESSVRETTSQVSASKVQLKRENKPVENTKVPEFLKIQLNKVDVKPTTNVVLSTTGSFGNGDENVLKKNIVEVEVDRDSSETIVENLKQRKFSKEDVEIIDKDVDEEIVEVPSKNIKILSVETNFKLPNEHIKKQLPNLISRSLNIQKHKSSIASISSLSPTSTKPFFKKITNSIELGDSIKKLDEKIFLDNQNKQITNSSDQGLNTKADSGKEKIACTASDDFIPDVILRKKSLMSQKRNKESDEPELMKVFARRSLKLKDSEADSLSQQVFVMVDSDEKITESAKRDSDKENDGGESPPEERKRNSLTTSKDIPKQKDPLTEAKFVETADVTLRKPSSTVNNKISSFGQKFQRAVTINAPVSNEINDSPSDARRNKSFIEPKTEKKSILNNYRSHIMNIREKDMEIKNTEITKTKTDDIITLKKDTENEDFVPLFKKIQQRKEEWEQRAQQNMKKSVP